MVNATATRENWRVGTKKMQIIKVSYDCHTIIKVLLRGKEEYRALKKAIGSYPIKTETILRMHKYRFKWSDNFLRFNKEYIFFFAFCYILK